MEFNHEIPGLFQRLSGGIRGIFGTWKRPNNLFARRGKICFGLPEPLCGGLFTEGILRIKRCKRVFPDRR